MIDIVRLMRQMLQVLCLVILDLSAFYIALLMAWVVRAEVMPLLTSNLLEFNLSYIYFVSLWWIPLIFIFFIFYETLYHSNQPFWDEAKNLIKAVTLSTLTIMAIVTLGKMSDKVSRLVLIGAWAFSLFIFPLFRLWGKKVLYRTGIWRERVLILGAGKSGTLVAEGLEREKHMGYDIVGFLDDDEEKKGKTICGKKVLGKISHFPKFIHETNIRTVIIAIPSLPLERLSALTANVQNHALSTILIPDLKGVALLNTELRHLFNEEIFLMNIKNNLKSIPNRVLKRLFDMTVSIVSLPILLPFIGIIGAAIRLETPGPAIYAHNRTGKYGKIFRCYKFRTMQRDAEEQLKDILENNETLRSEWEKNWKLKDDPRITKVGRFLRKTSLDELPQIFNVFKGEMSLVGPRPVTQAEIDDHYMENAKQCFCVPPGITGLWQVSGRSDTGYEFRVKLDTWYVMNWSLWLDIAILFKTMKVVANREGAY